MEQLIQDKCEEVETRLHGLGLAGYIDGGDFGQYRSTGMMFARFTWAGDSPDVNQAMQIRAAGWGVTCQDGRTVIEAGLGCKVVGVFKQA